MKKNLIVLGIVTSLTCISCTQVAEVPSVSTTKEYNLDDIRSYDAALRAGVKNVWLEDPFDEYNTTEDVAKNAEVFILSAPTLRATTTEDMSLDKLLRVADLLVEVCPADFKSAQEYSDALDHIIRHEGIDLSQTEALILHTAVVTASEATFLKYGSDLSELARLWNTPNSNTELRAYEPYGEREANAFAFAGSKIRRWWRSHPCARGIISWAIGGAIGGAVGGPHGAVAGAIGGAVGGALDAC